jgi:hypothetical protein
MVVSLMSGQRVAISDFLTMPSRFSNTAFTLSAFESCDTSDVQYGLEIRCSLLFKYMHNRVCWSL